jgi:hypothetical protein
MVAICHSWLKGACGAGSSAKHIRMEEEDRRQSSLWFRLQPPCVGFEPADFLCVLCVSSESGLADERAVNTSCPRLLSVSSLLLKIPTKWGVQWRNIGRCGDQEALKSACSVQCLVSPTVILSMSALVGVCLWQILSALLASPR